MDAVTSSEVLRLLDVPPWQGSAWFSFSVQFFITQCDLGHRTPHPYLKGQKGQSTNVPQPAHASASLGRNNSGATWEPGKWAQCLQHIFCMNWALLLGKEKNGLTVPSPSSHLHPYPESYNPAQSQNF
jgi:hypothetical protein